MEQLDFIYEAGETRRFHTVPIIRHQNIADHSWHVAMLAYTLYGQDEPGVTMAFIMACLTHDMAECRVGDLPAPAKRTMDANFKFQDAKEPVPDEAVTFREAWGEMEQEILSEFQMDWEKFLTDEEKRRLKFCDALEGLFYCIGERKLGNKNVGVCFNNFSNYVGELLGDVDLPLDKSNMSPEETVMFSEWQAFNLTQAQWDAANG